MSDKEGFALASLIIGIVSLVLGIVIGMFIIPIAIIGLMLGIVNVCQGGKKYAGIIINSVAFFLSFLWTFILMTIFAIIAGIAASSNVFEFQINHGEEEIVEERTIVGEWNCSLNDEEEYLISASFNNYKFVWAKYGDADNNYVSGTYTYDDYLGYYRLSLVGEQVIINSEDMEEEYKVNYKVTFDEDKLVLYNNSTNNTYYCDIKRNESDSV